MTSRYGELFIIQSLDPISSSTASVIERIADVDKFVEIGGGILAEPKDDVLVRGELLILSLRLCSRYDWSESSRYFVGNDVWCFVFHL